MQIVIEIHIFFHFQRTMIIYHVLFSFIESNDHHLGPIPITKKNMRSLVHVFVLCSSKKFDKSIIRILLKNYIR